jgi:hypothetical protein
MSEFTILKHPKILTFQGPEEWIDLPEHIWIKIFNNLSPSSILEVHQVSHNFHELANLYPRHELHLGKLLTSDENIEAFKKSSRLYDKVKFRFNFEDLTDVKFNQTIDLLKPTSFFVKELKLSKVTMEKLWVVRILKQLTNLELIDFYCLRTISPNQDQQSDGVISLPKLKSIKILHCDVAFETLLIDLRVSDITEVCVSGTFKTIGNSVNHATSIIKNHEKSLKKLEIEYNSISPEEWNFIGNLKEMRLEELALHCYRGETNLFLDFLRQNAGILKSLRLENCLSREMLELICGTLNDLEALYIYEDSWDDDYNHLAFQKLTKLKKFSFQLGLYDLNALEGFAIVINENLENITAPIHGATPEFIEKFATCVPNLKNLTITNSASPSAVKELLKLCKNLEKLWVLNIRTTFDRETEFLDFFGEFLESINDYGANLKEVFLSDDGQLDEAFIREKLKDRKGLTFKRFHSPSLNL